MPKFKPRARTLDLLGRQQIAGIPTAINELFKNAHDAYADNVEVDFYRKHNILLLRDDGVGMSLDDFENRWLTIGTESKADTKAGISKPKTVESKAKRPVMGEKGVGRLAIAVIGPQVLIITKSVTKDTPNEFVVSFINWSMFELPGVNLEDIEIPVKTYSCIQDITELEISELVLQVSNNLNDVEQLSDPIFVNKIREQLESFRCPQALLNLSYGPSLQADNTGTHFIITPTNESLIDDLSKTDGGISKLQKELLGFTNIMFGHNVPLKTDFRDHQIDGGIESELLGENFFEEEDYNNADHHIQGSFDEYGNFQGTISTYHEEPTKLTFIQNKTGRHLKCGSFNFKFGYLQGKESESLLIGESYQKLKNKTNLIGGIYLYKDGIRILPYGQTDYDWLEVEKRRTLHAGDNYFSFRRMIGAVDITRSGNPALEEKAGREGFMSNLAYRQFRDTLMEFLQFLAKKHFHQNSPYAEEFVSTRAILDREHKALEKRAKTKRVRSKLFNEDVERIKEWIDNTVPTESDILSSKLNIALDKLINDTTEKVTTLATRAITETTAESIIDTEQNALSKLCEIEDLVTIKKPNFGPNKTQARMWDSYLSASKEIIKPLLSSTKSKLTKLTGDIALSAKLHLDSKRRLEKTLETAIQLEFKKIDSSKLAMSSASKEADSFISETVKKNKIRKSDLELKFDTAVAELNKGASEEDISTARNTLELALEEVSQQATAEYLRIQQALLKITHSDSDDDEAVLNALESKVEVLQEDWNDNIENLQIGLAIKVINHEFSSNITAVRKSIKSLKKWSDLNSDLKPLYQKIRGGFDHLDSYLNLFTPLERRLNRKKTEITGVTIRDFIQELYEERFARHDVKIKPSDAFLNHNLFTHASTLFPVFINIIDNAIHWLEVSNSDIKTIYLDAEEDAFIVTDTGPGVSLLDQEHIFTLGFSRKLTGGGMGLYVAKTVLNKEGFDIVLSPQDPSRGAQFKIFKIQ